MIVRSAVLTALVFLSLLLLVILLLQACRLSLPFLPMSCPAVVAAPAEPVLEDRISRAVLEAQIASLERDLAGLVCTPEAPAPPAPPVVEEAQLDQERWDAQDLGLLEGCWQLDSDYAITDVDTGESSSVENWQVCFDDMGQGSQDLSYDNGVTCGGEVTASFQSDGTLVIADDNDVQCSNNTRIFRRDTTCEINSDGTADCRSRQPDHNNSNTPVRLRR